MQTKNKLTSHQKIVAIMANNKNQEWFFAKDIINQGEGDYYVGYEATARMSELVRKFPDMFESQGVGKYIKRRIRWEELELWFRDLPTEYRHIIHKAGRTRELRKNPHEVEDKTLMPDPDDFNKYVANYIGRDKNIKQGDQEIKINKLVMGQPVVVLANNDETRLTYMRIDQLRKDWIVK